MSTDPFAKILLALKENGSIPKSQLKSKKNLRRLQPLLDMKIISLERIRGGQRYSVNNHQGLQQFLNSEFPSGTERLPHLNNLPRCQAVVLKKDAHRAKSNCLPLFLRGFGDAKLTRGNQVLPVAELTKLAGGAAISIDEHCSWSFSGTVVTVENYELYFLIEKVIPETDLAICTSGRINNMLINWLASEHLKDSRFIHCGDLDPVGLQEYLRIKAKCPGRVKLYIPPDVEKLFLYANAERIKGQVSILNSLRKSNDDPDVLSIIKLIDKFNGGVDQELVLASLDLNGL